MADGEEPERSSKTEDPSQKRLDDAHKRGDVVKSQEVTTWFTLAGSALVLSMLAVPASSGVTQTLAIVLGNADQFEIGGAAFGAFFNGLAQAVVLVLLVPLAVLAVFAVAGNLIQHRPLLSLDPIKPRLSKISPLSGAKRLFSTEALVNFVKELVKLGLVTGALVFVLQGEISRLETMVTADPAVLLQDVLGLSLKLFGAALIVVTLIALVDYAYQRNKWWQRLRMTVQEVRDEYKQMEGDPQIKGRIRQIRQDRGRQRMMAQVPEASVVITNPTHFAVALKYDRAMAAPVCVAKGADAVALRIREMAREHDVPIVENPPLARALFASVDIDESIPAEHFKAVAQVIGYVMRLKESPRWRA